MAGTGLLRRLADVESLVKDTASVEAEFGLQRFPLRRDLVVVQVHQRTVHIRRG